MDELTTQFAELFHFNAEDLALNRSGVLSENQHDRLRKWYRRNVFLFVIFSSAFPIIVLGFIRLRVGGTPPGLPLFIVLTMSFWGFFLVWTWLSYRRKLTALRERVVEMTSGILQIEQKPQGNNKVWCAVFGTAEFSLSNKEGKFLVSKQGNKVSAYSIAKLRRIVSLETVQ